MKQPYLEVAGEASGAAAGEASGEAPAARAAALLFILSVFPGDVFVSALAARAARFLQPLTLPTEIFISEATSLIDLP